MKIKPKIRTAQEIDQIVAGFSGTWVRRRNAMDKFIAWSNDLVDKDINLQRAMIRKLKASGVCQHDLSPHFAEITRLELMKI